VSEARAALRVGVVGCGTIAYWTHLRAVARLPGATLVAAADPDREARSRAARLTRLAPRDVHASADELLARDDVDAVVLCPPTPRHAEVALASCAREKPFYLEKPIATSSGEAERLAAAARAAGIVAVAGFNRRHHPVHERARELVAAGAVGRVRAVLTAFCEPTPPERMPGWKRCRASGGGVLLDLGSHHVDLVRWLLADEVHAVEARIASEASEADSAWLGLATGGGVEVRSVLSFRTGPADWLTLLGERGTLHVDRFRCALELRTTRRFGYGTRRVRLAPRLANAGWRLQRVVRPSHEPSYGRALGAFVDEVRGGPSRCARLLDGARCLAVLEAAEEAARTGTPVRVVGSDADPARD